MSPESEARAHYMEVGSDIMALLEMRRDLLPRLEAAISRLGDDPLNFRASLNEALGHTTQPRTSTPPRRGLISITHHVWKFALNQNGHGFVLSDVRAALEPKGIRGQSISPALSSLKKAEVVAQDTQGRWCITERGKNLALPEGVYLSDKMLITMGFLEDDRK